MEVFPKFTGEQWDELKNKIDCPSFDRLQPVETITLEDRQYRRMQFCPPQEDLYAENAANDFATKYVYNRLRTSYTPVDMKPKWYVALDLWWSNQDTKVQKDLEEFFPLFTNVTTIGDQFLQRGALSSHNITIPKSVTTIDEWALSRNRMKTVHIPDTVTFLGLGAFSGNRLQKVEIPSSITTIAPELFQDNMLKEVVLPETITVIGYGAFQRNFLRTVTIPNSVRTIGRHAFTNCALTESLFQTG